MRCPNTPFATRLSGSAKETQLRIRSILQGKRHRPPVWLFTLIVAVITSSFGLVSCRQVEEKSTIESAVPETNEAIQETTQTGAEDELPRIERAELTGLTLDGDGIGDDAAYLESVLPRDWSQCTATLQIVLGSGETLEHRWDTPSYPHLSAARLTDLNRDSLIAALSDVGSTYGAEMIYVLDVVDGRLVKRLSFNGVGGSYVEGNTLRLAQLVNKWFSPEFYTAVWNGEDFDLAPDGYLLDDHQLSHYGASGTQGELTLRLRIPTDEDQFQNIDEIQILRGEEIIQLFASDDYDPLYANSYAAMTPLQVKDINFDGHPDFGILCDQSRDAKHHWFIWDEAERRFRFFGTLSMDLTVDDTVWQIKEVVWGEDSSPYMNYYGVSYTGKLIPLLRPAEEQPRFMEQTEIFQSVLRLKMPVLDATDGGREREITYTINGNTFAPAYFAVVDMDRDGNPEVVLWKTLSGNSYIGFDILRYEAGRVVSYHQVYRGLTGLKQDGTFSFSSGAFDHGFGKMEALREDGNHIENITWCQQADNTEGMAFFVDGRESDAAHFDAALARQDEKPGVVWYTMTEENIAILGSIISAAAE